MDMNQFDQNKQPRMEFHVSRRARDRYRFNEALFQQSGNVIFTNFHAARLFAQKMNAQRDLLDFPEQAVRAGQINAMGLIDEILHLVIEMYRQEQNPDLGEKALDWLYGMLGQQATDATLRRFAGEFPPLAVYRREIGLDEYLEGETTGVPNRQILVEELLMLWIANTNPAFAPFQELFDDSSLDKESAYRQIISSLRAFFDTQPPFGPEHQNLMDMLRAPAIAVPHSLSGQLEFIRQRWGFLLGKFLYRLLSSLDLIREEEKAIFLGPGPARVYDFTGMELEMERFSQDREWMPSLVLIAKNAYVWLDQLSKKYQRRLTRLDDIPEEELRLLGQRGFSGLWLIGLWERSQASKRIKQMRGNPEAVASAYSLFEYQIASDLGGEGAYQVLRDRAWLYGIRLASDMVPNHMGIDSRWVLEHPDWFISLDYSPFPSYSFNGSNLSGDERVGIYIEDHYFDNTDAAVVFKRIDHWTGSEKYIYHGNDGTSMPWNDTAQLNYLLPEVREAVIQTILSVARKFPVIRFDAAMTLAKKHYQRLWFPEPGTGGAIPSRAEHGLTKEAFDAQIPEEFWRQVVDRVAQEVPDTLLLAEAFWLMEGYFVRTLGMHRVYNSAFMNMLRDEKNAEYRLVIKNTLEFDPEILKRYVNFMNNPDERTAIDQFGKDDKYFGVATLMATMPGLPMFGHGQIEGYTEKYGMEYQRAYWDEYPDEYLVARHEREIFPLLLRRRLFAEVADFLLYDFYTPEGHVNEDVFAFSNRLGDDRSLVVYHNKFASTRGWIRTSAAYSVKTGVGSERTLMQKSLAEGLGLDPSPETYVIFRDQITGLEYIRSNQEISNQGLYNELEAYKYHVYLDFRQVFDNEWHQYAQLAGYLNGRGVPSIDEALKEVFLQPVHFSFREMVNEGMFRWIISNRTESPGEEVNPEVLDQAEQKMAHLLREINHLIHTGGDVESIASRVRRQLEAALKLPVLGKRAGLARAAWEKTILPTVGAADHESEAAWGTLLSWLFTTALGSAVSEMGSGEISRSWVDEWMLGKIIAAVLMDLELDENAAWRSVSLVKVLLGHQDWCWRAGNMVEPSYQLLQEWLQDADVQRFIGVNRYQDILWFNQESFRELLGWLFRIAVVQILAGKTEPVTSQEHLEQSLSETLGEEAPETVDRTRQIEACYKLITQLQQAEAGSGYQVERLLEAAKR